MGIRFIDLEEQLGCFAFYQTTVDRFLEYNENQTWLGWSSFERDFKADPRTGGSTCDYLKKYCADWVFPENERPSKEEPEDFVGRLPEGTQAVMSEDRWFVARLGAIEYLKMCELKEKEEK